MTPQAAASMIVAALPATTTPDDVEKLTDYQWSQLAELCDLPAGFDFSYSVSDETRRHVAALLKARLSSPADPFAGLPQH